MQPSSSSDLVLQATNAQLPDSLSDLANVFDAKECEKLLKQRPSDLKINLIEGVVPTWGKFYPTNPAQGKVLKEYLDVNLTCGFLRRSFSSCSSPIFFVKKSDGTQRPVVDYAKLNNITFKHQNPVPSAETLTDKLCGVRIST